ncbi:MAG: VOC family protein [Ilumatobacteraceae bacterium]
MRTLHFGLRVADMDRSIAFYTAVGYEVVGAVPGSPIGQLTMLKLPDDEFVTIELVHEADRPVDSAGSTLSHFVIHVESIDATIAALSARGIEMEHSTSPDGSADFRTTWTVDPDGNRIELVQWPAGHAVGMSVEDFVS